MRWVFIFELIDLKFICSVLIRLLSIFVPKRFKNFFLIHRVVHLKLLDSIFTKLLLIFVCKKFFANFLERTDLNVLKLIEPCDEFINSETHLFNIYKGIVDTFLRKHFGNYLTFLVSSSEIFQNFLIWLWLNWKSYKILHFFWR